MNKIKPIAIYLPQFHPIPENDEWWGKGFTEWRNVAKARPVFKGHYQPHLPADLGFYDLRLPEVREAQAQMARDHGIFGFCYYHYWFNGRRLLYRPIDEVLKSGKPDFPFCLNWANENWTRAWNGSENNALIKQNYSRYDDEKHIEFLLKVFSDERYIKIDGKPLIIIYSPELLPDQKQTTDIWRKAALNYGFNDLYIAGMEKSQRLTNPYSIGFDAVIEFSPNWTKLGDSKKNSHYEKIMGLISASYKNRLKHSVYDYRNLAVNSKTEEIRPYPYFRGITPGWDNSPRRKENATILINSTPGNYSSWLRNALFYTLKNNAIPEKFIFINAWNEWAEGNHLEPCSKWGLQYLEATQKTLNEVC
jgi:lipopolysaccharide biosynthesis protein